MASPAALSPAAAEGAEWATFGPFRRKRGGDVGKRKKVMEKLC